MEGAREERVGAAGGEGGGGGGGAGAAAGAAAGEDDTTAHSWPMTAVDLVASCLTPAQQREKRRKKELKRAKSQRGGANDAADTTYASGGSACTHWHCGLASAAGEYFYWDSLRGDARWDLPGFARLFEGAGDKAEAEIDDAKLIDAELIDADTDAHVDDGDGDGDEDGDGGDGDGGGRRRRRWERRNWRGPHMHAGAGAGALRALASLLRDAEDAEGARGGKERANTHVRFADGEDEGHSEALAPAPALSAGGSFAVDWGALGAASDGEDDEEQCGIAASTGVSALPDVRAARRLSRASLPPNGKKYWQQRYRLFTRFDEGIALDGEGWFSATPEALAAHQAARLGALCRASGRCSGLAVDAFCGAGGNVIALAHAFERVLAVDTDPGRLEMARANCAVYGVAHRVEFVCADARHVLGSAAMRRYRPDAVFLSPPWGGPDYLLEDEYDAEADLLPEACSALLARALACAPQCAVFLPRNTSRASVDAARRAAAAAGAHGFEEELDYLHGKLKAVTLYAGALPLADAEAALAPASSGAAAR